MKKIGILFMSILCLILTGCGNNGEATNSNGGNTEIIKGNCTAFECIKQIEISNSLEEINNIIGFEGELVDEAKNKYYWEISENTGVEVIFYSGNKLNAKIVYDRDSLANKKVDFSRYEELKSKINDGITYDEFITYIGNVDGILIEKGSSTSKYIWVADEDRYLNATFNKENKCTFASGRI